MRNAGPNGDASAGLPDTRDRIRRVFIKSLHLNLGEGDLDYERKLDESVGMDSLATIEFVAALEKEFGFTIEPEMLRLDFIRDLPQLAAYVEGRKARIPRSPA